MPWLQFLGNRGFWHGKVGRAKSVPAEPDFARQRRAIETRPNPVRADRRTITLEWATAQPMRPKASCILTETVLLPASYNAGCGMKTRVAKGGTVTVKENGLP